MMSFRLSDKASHAPFVSHPESRVNDKISCSNQLVGVFDFCKSHSALSSVLGKLIS